MTTQGQPLDEIQARRPDVLQWWADGVEGLPGPFIPMEERMIYRYFSEQPFFDWTTKNGITLSQANTNWDTFLRVHNRKAFETQLRSQPGVEYMITGEPQQISDAPLGVKNGMWTIKKQERLRGDRAPDGSFPHTETLGTYFIIGENVYQAPSVADVIGNRLLSATTSLSKFFDKAVSLPTYTPTTGHTYLPHTVKPTATGSTTASPARSREGSVALSMDAPSPRPGSVAPEGDVSAQAQMTSAQDARLLLQSLQLSIQFGDEYMDENPLVGEPGSFRFTTTARDVKKRKQVEEAAASRAREQKENATASSSSRAASPKAVEKAPSPPPVFTESKASGKGEKEKLMSEKKRRKKSRTNVQGGPTTPGGATMNLSGPNSAS